ncbi:MAG: serine hydrolase domain-containing protein [Verrucomicrobiaceae bacterium]
MRWILILALTLSAHARQAGPTLNPDKLNAIGPAIEALIAEQKLAGGSVLVLHRGKTVYQQEFGYRNIDKKLPIEKDTLFRIYSMTKGITSAAALILCEEGKLSLDDPIGLHLPALKNQAVLLSEDKTEPARRHTTVRDLLRHTSGYANSWSGDFSKIYRDAGVGNSDASLSQTIEALGPLPLLYQPGERWVYGLSSDVLAAVVASAAKQPFEDFIQERLLTPLGMQDTSFYIKPKDAPRLAVTYSPDNGTLKGHPLANLTALKNPPFKGGGSGLISTISDYARFLQMIANGGTLDGTRYLREDTVTLMRTNQLPLDIPCISFGEEQRHGTGFGLGFCVRTAKDERWDPHAPIGEYGWGGAASTHYWISPQHDLVVVTMEQTMPYNWNLETTVKPLVYSAFNK